MGVAYTEEGSWLSEGQVVVGCGKVCIDVAQTTLTVQFIFPSDEIPRRRLVPAAFTLGGSIFRHMRKRQRKRLSALRGNRRKRQEGGGRQEELAAEAQYSPWQSARYWGAVFLAPQQQDME